MKDFKSAVIGPEATLKQAMISLQTSNVGICLVLSSNRQLAGVITDGDIRRGLLNSVGLEEKCGRVMSLNPKCLALGTAKKEILKFMEKYFVQHVPLLGPEGQVVELALYKDLIKHEEYGNIVFINAGGIGKRLWPLTENTPKPLLTIGSKPIMENIIENFQKSGFRNFYLSVNYKADMIKDHFGDGSKWGVKINYVTETDPLGTAGAISFLKGKTNLPILVSNGDLLTNVDYEGLLSFHNKSKCVATMCVREHDFQIPYGVVQISEGRMTSIAEKPIHKFFINAGIYVLNSEVLENLKLDHRLDMPDLLEDLRAQHAGKGVGVFPIHEYWLDIGQLDDFQRAQSEFSKFTK